MLSDFTVGGWLTAISVIAIIICLIKYETLGLGIYYIYILSFGSGEIDATDDAIYVYTIIILLDHQFSPSFAIIAISHNHVWFCLLVPMYRTYCKAWCISVLIDFIEFRLYKIRTSGTESVPAILFIFLYLTKINYYFSGTNFSRFVFDLVYLLFMNLNLNI